MCAYELLHVGDVELPVNSQRSPWLNKSRLALSLIPHVKGGGSWGQEREYELLSDPYRARWSLRSLTLWGCVDGLGLHNQKCRCGPPGGCATAHSAVQSLLAPGETWTGGWVPISVSMETKQRPRKMHYIFRCFREQCHKSIVSCFVSIRTPLMCWMRKAFGLATDPKIC